VGVAARETHFQFSLGSTAAMLMTWPRTYVPRLVRCRELAQLVLAACERLRDAPDSALRSSSAALGWQAQVEASSPQFLVDAFALVREAARRVHGQAHYDTQLIAGFVLARGGLAEMQTGEGKTLSALLPAFARALAGKGVHIVTANDYLAERDATFARSVFELLGLSVGFITSEIHYADRGPQYCCDVTYGAAREFGFDFLRDKLAQDASGDAASRQQRELYFALVDEADSVLIDDARTPLLIAADGRLRDDEAEFYGWCDAAASRLAEGLHFRRDRRQTLQLTNDGCRTVTESALANRRIDGVRLPAMERTYRQVEQSLVARLLMHRDRDYVVGTSGVEIVDASTGRVSSGRKWREGLQQAIEAKERIERSADVVAAAQISVQCYFRRYAHVAGMTGTAQGSAREFRRVYCLPVTVIPPRKPCQRATLPPRMFVTRKAKAAAIADDVSNRVKHGQAVLVGAASVEASESLGQAFRTRGIDHVILNCLRHEEEARIVSQAGQPGAVTIATNMAGRGTDIAVSEDVLAVGGLHVIAADMHASPRIDRQLVGRTARQGDPGSCQSFLSLDDELLANFTSGAFQRAKRRAQRAGTAELPGSWLRWFRRAQRGVEVARWRERQELLHAERRREQICRDCGLDPVVESVV
jgi:preprotein translocase subunit SecA